MSMARSSWPRLRLRLVPCPLHFNLAQVSCQPTWSTARSCSSDFMSWSGRSPSLFNQLCPATHLYSSCVSPVRPEALYLAQPSRCSGREVGTRPPISRPQKRAKRGGILSAPSKSHFRVDLSFYGHLEPHPTLVTTDRESNATHQAISQVMPTLALLIYASYRGLFSCRSCCRVN